MPVHPVVTRTRDLTVLLLAPALAAAAGFLHITHSRVATLGVAGIGLVGLVAASPALLPVLAFPAIWVPGQRVAGLLSVGDAVLAVAAVLVLLDSARAPLSRTGRALIAVLGLLLATDIVAVLAHPTRQGAQEIVHRLILVGGGILVGAWLAERGKLAVTTGCTGTPWPGRRAAGPARRPPPRTTRRRTGCRLPRRVARGRACPPWRARPG